MGVKVLVAAWSLLSCGRDEWSVRIDAHSFQTKVIRTGGVSGSRNKVSSLPYEGFAETWVIG